MGHDWERDSEIVSRTRREREGRAVGPGNRTVRTAKTVEGLRSEVPAASEASPRRAREAGTPAVAKPPPSLFVTRITNPPLVRQSTNVIRIAHRRRLRLVGFRHC